MQREDLLRLRHVLEESLRSGAPVVCASVQRTESYRPEQNMITRNALNGR